MRADIAARRRRLSLGPTSRRGHLADRVGRPRHERQGERIGAVRRRRGGLDKRRASIQLDRPPRLRRAVVVLRVLVEVLVDSARDCAAHVEAERQVADAVQRGGRSIRAGRLSRSVQRAVGRHVAGRQLRVAVIGLVVTALDSYVDDRRACRADIHVFLVAVCRQTHGVVGVQLQSEGDRCTVDRRRVGLALRVADAKLVRRGRAEHGTVVRLSARIDIDRRDAARRRGRHRPTRSRCEGRKHDEQHHGDQHGPSCGCSAKPESGNARWTTHC